MTEIHACMHAANHTGPHMTILKYVHIATCMTIFIKFSNSTVNLFYMYKLSFKKT